ncbi:MAG: A24 family peptidase C-terminal domain-containing protein [Thermoprotei archaeon]
MDLAEVATLTDSLLVAVMLGLGAYQDVKYREIYDWVWLICIPAAGFNVFAILNGALNITFYQWILELVAVAAVGFALSFLRLFGEADALAILASAAAMPVSNQIFHSQIPWFGLTVFDNGVIFAAMYTVALALYNTAMVAAKPGYLSPYSKSGLRQRLMLVTAGRKLPVKKYLEYSYKFLPLESFALDSSGIVVRTPTFGASIDVFDKREEQIKALVGEGRLSETEPIWVSPGIPVVTCMFVGLLFTHFVGDIVFMLALHSYMLF